MGDKARRKPKSGSSPSRASGSKPARASGTRPGVPAGGPRPSKAPLLIAGVAVLAALAVAVVVASRPAPPEPTPAPTASAVTPTPAPAPAATPAPLAKAVPTPEAKPKPPEEEHDSDPEPASGQSAPIPTPPPAPATALPKGVPAGCLEAKVVRCKDGDTIVVHVGGKDETVRMKGVDTPETVHPSKPVQYFGKEASNYTKERLTGKTVWLELEKGGGRDKYGRLLAFIWLEDGTCHNELLIRDGYGHAYTVFPFDRMDRYRALEKEARAAKKGLWGDSGAPVAAPAATPKPTKKK